MYHERLNERDNEGDPLSYSWTDSDDSERCTTATCDVTENGADTYSYTLSVNDTYGATVSDDVEVTVVSEPNIAPEIEFSDTLVQNETLPHNGVPGGCMDVVLNPNCAGNDENGEDLLEYDFSADNGFSENSDECSITAEFCEGLAPSSPFGERPRLLSDGVVERSSLHAAGDDFDG